MIKYLIEKEFKQMLRNPFLPKMIFFFPIIMMVLIPWAANMEVKNLNMSVIDNDHSSFSKRLIEKVSNSKNFELTNLSTSYEEALRSVEKGESDIIMEIPKDFEKGLRTQNFAKVMISANSVNGTKGGIGSSYLVSILKDFNEEIKEESSADLLLSAGIIPNIKIVPLSKYNAQMDYKLFMVPALMVMLLTMLCGFLPALNIVSEKEAGTIEQINVTPVKKFTFILAKLIPYWVVGFIVLTICVIFAKIIYGLSPEGSLFTFYLFASVFVLVVSGMGLVISNYSNTMQQAMFVMYFFILILILMSGLFTPVESMPGWAKAITVVNPMKYFIQVMRMVYLKGSGIEALMSQMVALLSSAVILNLWAVISYKKSN